MLLLQELAAVRGTLLAAVARDADSVQTNTLLHLLACARCMPCHHVCLFVFLARDVLHKIRPLNRRMKRIKAAMQLTPRARMVT